MDIVVLSAMVSIGLGIITIVRYIVNPITKSFNKFTSSINELNTSMIYLKNDLENSKRDTNDLILKVDKQAEKINDFERDQLLYNQRVKTLERKVNS